jgi:lactate permease
MIFAWLSFIVPYILIAYFIGPELPSIVGGFTGVLVSSLAAHYGLFVPKNIIKFGKQKTKEKISLITSLKVLAPYLIIISLLTLSRILNPLKIYLNSVSLNWESILGSDISYSFLPIYTPSFYFILAALSCIFLFRANFDEVKTAFRLTLIKIKIATSALIFTVALVQLLLISGNNPLGIPGIPLLLASFFESLFRQYFVLISPFIGAFGSFIAGSNTVSNLLFASFQLETAKSLGVSLVVILSLQVVGGAIGNMIAIHNILAASATVGLKGQEGNIIRKTIWVMLFYALITAILGFIFISIF